MTAARWLVADGESGGAGEASTYVLVANTGSAACQGDVHAADRKRRHAHGPGHGQRPTAATRMDVASTFPEARGTRFSVLVDGVSGTAPLVVERASYSSTPSTPWASGTNSLAMPLY